MAAAPPLLAVAFVLVGFVANDVPIMWLIRPLAVAILVALAIEALFWGLLGPIRGPTWAFIVLAAVADLFVLAGATVLVLTAFTVIRSREDLEYELVGALATAFGAVFVVVTVGIGVRGGAFDWRPSEQAAIDLGSAQPGPSIHMLMLDGYPRADVLAELGMDNGAFLDGLSERGFDVHADSLSNYDLTPFSILSILSLRHFDEIEAVQLDPIPPNDPEQQRVVTRALLDAPIFTALERVGYRTRLLTGDVVLISLGGADEVWNAGTVTNFELDSLQRTVVAPVVDLINFGVGQHAVHIERTLEVFAEAPQVPTFTFAHVIAPHAPFVYEADGTLADSPPCYPTTCQLFNPFPDQPGSAESEEGQPLLGHIEHLNQLVLAAVDRVIEEDPGGVVVLVSDHGVYGPDRLDRYRNLIAARTPGHPGLLGTAPTPVNILPRILNGYLGTDLPLHPDTLYRSGDPEWISLVEIAGE